MEPGKEDSPGNSQCCEGLYSHVPQIHHIRGQADNIRLFLTQEERATFSTKKVSFMKETKRPSPGSSAELAGALPQGTKASGSILSGPIQESANERINEWDNKLMISPPHTFLSFSKNQ